MKIRELFATCAILLIAARANTDNPPPNLRDAIRDGKKLIQERVASQVTNVFQVLEQMTSAYDAQHASDLWIEVLSVKQLQRLTKERTNDLAPRLLLLPRELANDQDCNDWFATLKESFGLCTNDLQRVTCLGLAITSTFSLEGKGFGKPMLGQMDRWLKELSSQRPSAAVGEKIQYLQLFVAVAAEAYSEASVYSRGTPMRTLIPVWMMSKGKWEFALREVRELKRLPDLSIEDKRALDVFEAILAGITETKSDK